MNLKLQAKVLLIGVAMFACGPFLASACMHEVAPLLGKPLGQETVLETAFEFFLISGMAVGIVAMAAGVAVSVICMCYLIEDYLE